MNPRPKRKSTTVTTTVTTTTTTTTTTRSKKRTKNNDLQLVIVPDHDDNKFVGNPVPDNEARSNWPHRYSNVTVLSSNDTEKPLAKARCHYYKAEVDGIVYSLNDDAFVRSKAREESYVCKIVEIFERRDGEKMFYAQWYFRPGDTVIQQRGELVRDRSLFISEIKDDNPLESLISKLVISPTKADGEGNHLPYDFYCDKKYLLPYSSFVNLQSGASFHASANEESSAVRTNEREVLLLDLYAGCGAMSTGLCLGANAAGVKLVTKWAVDNNEFACESLKLNHPETEVRHEAAEDFFVLTKEWDKLRCSLSLEVDGSDKELRNSDGLENVSIDTGSSEVESGVFEVEKILGFCLGDPIDTGERGLHFKVRWMGYGPKDDTWEPLESLSSCKDVLKKFVSRACKSKILPLPGTVDVICGGPPCQGVSGYNRYRNEAKPLEDPKNKQIIVYMNIVEFLKPRFVLMENVVDLLKFADGYLGRYALGRIVSMGYQTRMGLMAAGFYGLPQFRMRVFVWGARTTERLPQFPLPTHDADVRGYPPTEFEHNTVAYEEGHGAQLKEKLNLGHAITDLPPVLNNEKRDEMPYGPEAQNVFQQFIRLRKNEMPGSLNFNGGVQEHELYDHRPHPLNIDDYQRVCLIPKRKGANFRDLPGLIVIDNKVAFDPNVPRKFLKSGKPLVPSYAMTFEHGRSPKPFGRLWWDDTVPTVVTRPEPHNQIILHPSEDRVLTVRENARLQGFPDYYKLVGSVKDRYIQVGNAVAVPVARALGHSLALALLGLSGDDPLFTLPESFPHV